LQRHRAALDRNFWTNAKQNSSPHHAKSMNSNPLNRDSNNSARPGVSARLVLFLLPLFLAAVPVLPAQEKPDAPAGKNPPPARTVHYKESGGKPRRMELYLPPGHDAAKAKVPGLILFHGGGWSGGTPAQFAVACDYFASRGLVCATVEYQLMKKGAGAGKGVCISDAKSAIRWFKQHAGELGVDPQRIITGGGSAGGHISALATMNPGLNDPADAKDTDTSVVAYLWFNPAFSPADAKDKEVDILRHARTALPPAIVFFGSEDKTWLPGWNAALEKWQSLGVRSIEYHVAPGQGHGFFNTEPWRTLTLLAADRFLVRHGLLSGEPTLKAPATSGTLVPHVSK
jgi:acetyl esterase